MNNDENSHEKLSEFPAKPAKDSFEVPVKKSPLFMYALLQIPLVLFMVLLLYFMYQSKQD